MDKQALAPQAASPLAAYLSYEVSEIFAPCIIQISGWPPVATLEKKMAKIFGILPDIGAFSKIDDTRIFSLAPATWLIISETTQTAEKLAKITPDIAAVTDNSGGRVIFEISGDHGATKLSKGTLLDFSLTAFPVGEVKQSAIHHINVLIARIDDTTFQVSPMRSFADDLKNWLRKH